jgi:hydrogenase nickel incorporation protein HypA/HybF
VHELGIVMEIIELASDRFGELKPIKLVVEIGTETAVCADALRFAWEVATEDSALSGCSLEIVERPGQELQIRSLVGERV